MHEQKITDVMLTREPFDMSNGPTVTQLRGNDGVSRLCGVNPSNINHCDKSVLANNMLPHYVLGVYFVAAKDKDMDLFFH